MTAALAVSAASQSQDAGVKARSALDGLRIDPRVAPAKGHSEFNALSVNSRASTAACTCTHSSLATLRYGSEPNTPISCQTCKADVAGGPLDSDDEDMTPRAEGRRASASAMSEDHGDEEVTRRRTTEAAARTASFHVGDVVQGLVLGWRPCEGRIEKDNGDGTFVLSWEDGYALDNVKRADELTHLRTDIEEQLAELANHRAEHDPDYAVVWHGGDDYDIAWAVEDFAHKRVGDVARQQREDAAAALFLLKRQAAALELALSRPKIDAGVQAHYAKVRQELLAEAAQFRDIEADIAPLLLKLMLPHHGGPCVSASEHLRDGYHKQPCPFPLSCGEPSSARSKPRGEKRGSESQSDAELPVAKRPSMAELARRHKRRANRTGDQSPAQEKKLSPICSPREGMSPCNSALELGRLPRIASAEPSVFAPLQRISSNPWVSDMCTSDNCGSPVMEGSSHCTEFYLDIQPAGEAYSAYFFE
eukprot:TRINITY_DN110855_c0_g1_i1.p1 TRINITY_DN110855_c0_g1~~TRINITY_DN110855_c0_g1_i1.p1  ORF type:complete len:477 (+),score=99.70 TRINITY_DN110855_c0_g1_i1:84-1514(+)